MCHIDVINCTDSGFTAKESKGVHIGIFTRPFWGVSISEKFLVPVMTEIANDNPGLIVVWWCVLPEAANLSVLAPAVPRNDFQRSKVCVNILYEKTRSPALRTIVTVVTSLIL